MITAPTAPVLIVVSARRPACADFSEYIDTLNIYVQNVQALIARKDEKIMARQKPLKDDNTRNLTMRISDELLARIDERRRVEPDIPSRTELMRRLIIKELDAWEAGNNR